MSSKKLALEVHGLSKRYLISHQEKHTFLGSAIMAKLKNPLAKPEQEEFWALRDVSFQVEQGDVLGVIGRNGAGKSTLLKILSQIAEPTEGEIRLHGRIGSLLEVGTGFHPELTGRENIFLNGTILGMRKSEVTKHFDEIVAFAEVEKFLDTPVKRYSSGMYVRLAFAVAAHLNPEILIVDEVLAVGDAQFQAKCLGKMQDVSKEEGRTVLFVSHNMAAVRALCTKALMLKSGRVEYIGDTDRAIEVYSNNSDLAGTIVERAKVINEGIVLNQITVNGSDSPDLQLAPHEQSLEIVVRGEASRELKARFGVYLTDVNELPLAHFGEGIRSGPLPSVAQGPFEWRATIDLPTEMNEGIYFLTIDVSEHTVQAWVVVERAIQINKEGVRDSLGHALPYSSYGLTLLDGSVIRTSTPARQSR